MSITDNPSKVIETEAAKWFISRFVSGSPAKSFLERYAAGEPLQARVIQRNARWALVFRWNEGTNSVLVVAMSSLAAWAAGEIQIVKLGKNEYFKYYPRIEPSTDKTGGSDE